MRSDELIESVKKYDKKADIEGLRRACIFAEKMHYDQQRETGEKYLIHPLAVAEILLAYKMDAETIMAALLHDTVEDTPASYDSVKALFGKSVADLVQGLTKLESYQLQSSASGQAENFQKLILASSKDIRVLFVKLADRLHNMRTLDICSEEKKRRKAQETMDIYVPLAERLGLHKIKTELEDLSFRVLNPKAYNNLTQKINELQKKQNISIQNLIKEIETILSVAKIKARVIGRVKMPYSLWRKLQTHQNQMSSIFDVLGIRIITKNIPDCYKSLGLVHQQYRAVMGRFKDYISTPKDSGYQSLQTTVMSSKGIPLEIQIRTEEMEEEAMFGMAAHWSYKQGEKYDGKNLPWMKEFLTLISNTQSPAEFLRRAKLHMEHNKIFCFDHKGIVYSLPQGATALDFACYLGSKVALKCTGVEINNEKAPLNQKLNDGDKVSFKVISKIVAQKSWLKDVTTAYAKLLLENFFSEEKAPKKESFFKKIWSKKKVNPEILGLPEGIPYELDTVCHPKEKDAIIAIKENDKVVIHKRNCPILKRYFTQTEKWMSVEWNTTHKTNNKQVVALSIMWKTNPESMGHVVNQLSKMKVDIQSMTIISQEHSQTKAQAMIKVKGKDHLLDVLDAIRSCKGVQRVYETKEKK